MHVAWSRIDEDTLTAKPLPFFKERLKKISRELEIEFGLEPVKNERKGPIKYAPTKAQDEQARRLGVDIHEIQNTIRECWDRSDNGRSFQAALEHEGLTLAQGDRRGFVVIDHGRRHSLPSANEFSTCQPPKSAPISLTCLLNNCLPWKRRGPIIMST